MKCLISYPLLFREGGPGRKGRTLQIRSLPVQLLPRTTAISPPLEVLMNNSETPFARWLRTERKPGPGTTHAGKLGLVFEELPCGCAGQERVRCYCEQRALRARIDWLEARDNLVPELGPEPSTTVVCTCPEFEERSNMRSILIHPDGKVFHWPCGRQIGQLTAEPGSATVSCGG